MSDIVTAQFEILKDIPNFFYTHEKYDFVYDLTLIPDPRTTAVIVCNDGKEIKEVYRATTSEHPATILDIGNKISVATDHFGGTSFSIILSSVNIEDTFVREFKASNTLPFISIIKGISDITFTSSLTDFAFAVEGVTQPYKAKVVLTYRDKELLSEMYIPDGSGVITLTDICGIVEPYLVNRLAGDFDIEITAFHEVSGKLLATKKISFTAIYCKTDINLPATDFIGTYFLSSLMGDKVTTLGRSEFLHFVANKEPEKVTAAIYAEYVDDSYNKAEEVFNISVNVTPELAEVKKIDVSPGKFVKEGFTLVSYRVILGNKRQRYVVREAVDTDPAIVFKNSFGVFDTLYFAGTKTDDAEITRSASYINGRYRNYHLKEVRTTKAETGVLPESMICLVDELARSTEVYLIEHGELGREIVITDEDLKRTNQLDELYNFAITYRLETKNQNTLNFRNSRIFDYTFDYTFK